MKQEAKLSANEIPGVEEANGDGDLRCRSLLTVIAIAVWGCQEMRRRRWSSSVGCED